MFLRALKYACFAPLAGIQANILRDPIERNDFKSEPQVDTRFANSFRTSDPNHGEQPLLDDPRHGKTPLRYIGWGYTIDITVGIPPQPITVLLDINWSTFFVQSSYCTTYLCSRNSLPTFNRTASHAYFPIYQPALVFYNNGAKFGGNISTDYTNIANVEIPALFFVDADEVDPIAWIAFYSGYSGVLGLSRNSSNSGVDVSSAWEWLVKEGWLDKSVFSLSFPRGGGRFGPREPGEFALGSYPEGFEKDGAIALPLKDAYGAWATTVESLRFGPNLTEEFEDGIAYFTTTNSFLSLPGDWFWSIFNATGADFRNGRYPSVDCSKRGEIPKLTLGIGGQDVVLDGYQYTVVMNATQDDCALGVGPSENGAVGLGSVFMENFLMVFDADEDSVFISERASEE